MVAGGSQKGRPERVAGTSSRHDWAGPGGVILLFNCHCCSFQMAEGSDAAALMAESDDVTVTAAFNLQASTPAPCSLLKALFSFFQLPSLLSHLRPPTPLSSPFPTHPHPFQSHPQVIGRFRAQRGQSDTFADRLEFDNVWLPWSSQSVKPGEVPTLLIQIKGKGRAAANVLATPWLSYGCSIGARLKTPTG